MIGSPRCVREHVGQVAVGRVVVVFDVAAEADDVEQHVVQMGQPGLRIGRMDAAADGVRELRRWLPRLDHACVGLLVPRNRKRGAEQIRASCRHRGNSRCKGGVGGGMAVGGHGALYA